MANEIILIALFIGGFFYWSQFQRVKEIALGATKQHCLAMEVLMLDEYVAASGLRIVRDSHKKWQLQRSFTFEFSSTGEERYNGKIIMLGQKVASIYMEPYRMEAI